MTTTTAQPEILEGTDAVVITPRTPRVTLSPDSPIAIYVGIAVVLAGFAVITYAWSKVAALTAVPLQLPYLVSGGLVGIGLILVGLTIVAVGSLRRDGAARRRELERLAGLLRDLESS